MRYAETMVIVNSLGSSYRGTSVRIFLIEIGVRKETSQTIIQEFEFGGSASLIGSWLEVLFEFRRGMLYSFKHHRTLFY